MSASPASVCSPSGTLSLNLSGGALSAEQTVTSADLLDALRLACSSAPIDQRWIKEWERDRNVWPSPLVLRPLPPPPPRRMLFQLALFALALALVRCCLLARLCARWAVPPATGERYVSAHRAALQAREQRARERIANPNAVRRESRRERESTEEQTAKPIRLVGAAQSADRVAGGDAPNDGYWDVQWVQTRQQIVIAYTARSNSSCDQGRLLLTSHKVSRRSWNQPRQKQNK